MLKLGIDLGGTKIEIAAFDDQNNEQLRRRIATPQGDYRATVGAIVALVETVCTRAAQSALACPAPNLG
jgi:predicted NBD/HSP70 family sugar kinase